MTGMKSHVYLSLCKMCQTSSAGYGRNLRPKLFRNRICLRLLWRIFLHLYGSLYSLTVLRTACCSFILHRYSWSLAFGQPGVFLERGDSHFKSYHANRHIAGLLLLKQGCREFLYPYRLRICWHKAVLNSAHHQFYL